MASSYSASDSSSSSSLPTEDAVRFAVSGALIERLQKATKSKCQVPSDILVADSTKTSPLVNPKKGYVNVVTYNYQDALMETNKGVRDGFIFVKRMPDAQTLQLHIEDYNETNKTLPFPLPNLYIVECKNNEQTDVVASWGLNCQGVMPSQQADPQVYRNIVKSMLIRLQYQTTYFDHLFGSIDVDDGVRIAEHTFGLDASTILNQTPTAV